MFGRFYSSTIFPWKTMQTHSTYYQHLRVNEHALGAFESPPWPGHEINCRFRWPHDRHLLSAVAQDATMWFMRHYLHWIFWNYSSISAGGCPGLFRCCNSRRPTQFLRKKKCKAWWLWCRVQSPQYDESHSSFYAHVLYDISRLINQHTRISLLWVYAYPLIANALCIYTIHGTHDSHLYTATDSEITCSRRRFVFSCTSTPTNMGSNSFEGLPTNPLILAWPSTVVLTTFQALMNDLSHSNDNPDISSQGASGRRTSRKRKWDRAVPSPLQWRICDEARVMKLLRRPNMTFQ